ncbi:TetR/AcrR family transcriptional regulator [Chloroflexota bacterium]
MPKIIEDEKVYQAVLQTIIERGYAGATTKQMADAADVSEVTLFRKYESKLQLVGQAIVWLADQMNLASAAFYTGDIKADLLRVVQAYQESVVRHGQFFMVIISEMQRVPELTGLARVPFNIFQEIGQMLARYQAEGVLRQEHPLHALAALLGPMIYTTMMRSALEDDLLPPLDLSIHVSSFLEGRG